MNKQTAIKAFSAIAMSFAATFGASTAHAHSGETHKMADANASISTEEHAFGKQGDPKKATRTIAIDMADTMRFGPADITVKQGETIKFVVTNKGKIMHEMVIGTMAELKEHGELMKKHPGMEHDEPYMSHVSPGKKEEMVWQFTKAGEFYFACLIPGHFEAGMIGKITVKKG
ncbi:plastocyanin/azurin family copper-binding protein [Herbaspirillum sp. GCM10030257]|uniref:cupredoxin domain-containing protein n=1 Tax=Herbaspirillum sp. GCM10030257 TaxID=3273393 RepID=UPI003614632F